MSYRHTQASVPGAVTRLLWNRAPGPETNTMNAHHAAPTIAMQQPRVHEDGYHGGQASANVNNMTEPSVVSRQPFVPRYGYEMFDSGHMHYDMPNYHEHANVNNMVSQGLASGPANPAVGHGRNEAPSPSMSEVDMPIIRAPANTPSVVSASLHLNGGDLGSSSGHQPSSATTPFSMAADSFHASGYTYDPGHPGRGRFPAPMINGNAFGNQAAYQHPSTAYLNNTNTYQTATAIGHRDGDHFMGSPVSHVPLHAHHAPHGLASGGPPTVPPPGLNGLTPARVGIHPGNQGFQGFQGYQTPQPQLFHDARMGQNQTGQNGLALTQASGLRIDATPPTLPALVPSVLNTGMPSSPATAGPSGYNNHGGTVAAPGAATANNQMARSTLDQVMRYLHSQLERPRTSFLPSNAVLRSAGFDPTLRHAHELARLKIQHGISPNYQGDPTIARNHSANIPQSQNCSFWIVNLPPRVTTHELLSQIRNIGRIFACVINAPQPERGHCTAAAKVVFFDLWAAQRFYAVATRSRLVVGGYRVRVNLNRIRSAEAAGPGNRTRVIILKGDPSFVNEPTLTRWFSERFKFEIDEVITHVLNEHIGHVEYRFGSWRCQAETARVAIIRDLGYDGQTPKSECPVWEMKFGLDPCAPLPTSALI